jgi:hypothetical protein
MRPLSILVAGCASAAAAKPPSHYPGLLSPRGIPSATPGQMTGHYGQALTRSIGAGSGSAPDRSQPEADV